MKCSTGWAMADAKRNAPELYPPQPRVDAFHVQKCTPSDARTKFVRMPLTDGPTHGSEVKHGNVQANAPWGPSTAAPAST